MNLLCLDTSGPTCSVAVLRDGVLAYEAMSNNRLTHSESLMPMVEEALLRCGMAVADVALLAAVVGPGSFTGVRIGVAAVKGMARALGVPAIGVNALEALAYGVAGQEIICSIRDARAGQVYGAAFQSGQRLLPDSVQKLPLFLDAVSAFQGTLYFVGDGVPVHWKTIAQSLGERAQFAPRHLVHLKAGAAAMLAWENRDAATDSAELMPLYLRAPQAERQLKERNGCHA